MTTFRTWYWLQACVLVTEPFKVCRSLLLSHAMGTIRPLNIPTTSFSDYYLFSIFTTKFTSGCQHLFYLRYP
jgi:hypothetical protein